MFIAKKAISRRTVLRGLGAAVSLPVLDSMVPALSAVVRSAAAPVNRFGVMYVPNGMIMKNYLPLVEGREFEMTPTLSAIAPYRNQMLVVSGLNHLPQAGRPGGGHAKASTRFLTNISPPTSETWLDAGVSMDQILAQETGKHTQLASLELALESGENAGACDVGYACAYTNTLSWKGPSTPLPMQNDPRVAFERLFGDSLGSDPAERAARLRQRRSVLDMVTQEINRLQGALPGTDRNRLSAYLDSIRDVERRIQIAESQVDREVPLSDPPTGIPDGWEEHLNLMFDLMVLAYQCDATRVITLMIGREQSGMTFPQIGITDPHHPISHHQQEPEKIEKCAKINAYHMKMFSNLLGKMRAIEDGDGTLLDHMTMMYGAGMADSNAHAPRDLPIVIVGGGAGTLKGGRHLRFKDTPLANLHLTLLDQFGVHLDRFGDSTGRIDAPLLSL